jgi:DNA-binding protein Fis
VLDVTRNNKSEAAKILGIDRRSLYRRLHDDPGGDDATT